MNLNNAYNNNDLLRKYINSLIYACNSYDGNHEDLKHINFLLSNVKKIMEALSASNNTFKEYLLELNHIQLIKKEKWYLSSLKLALFVVFPPIIIFYIINNYVNEKSLKNNLLRLNQICNSITFHLISSNNK